jgi:outer membrane protein
MKKILALVAFLSSITTVLNADLMRIEAGAGAWMQTPNTNMEYKDNILSGNDKSTDEEETQGYIWLLVKHPIPIVPNIRLEYVNISSKGTATGVFHDFSVPGTSTSSTLEITQFDIIPYYNILDNTGWITLDLGIDLKVMETKYTANPLSDTPLTTFSGYEDKSSHVIPLGYVRVRFEIPTTNIGLESDVKYITYGDSEVLDFRAKIDYTLGFVPVIQPGVELGYRVQKINSISDEDLVTDFDFAGIYAGLMIRF